MADPGYGPNGTRRDVSGRIAFDANAPPITINPGDDVWTIEPLGLTTFPFINQLDDEAHSFIYLGGV